MSQKYCYNWAAWGQAKFLFKKKNTFSCPEYHTVYTQSRRERGEERRK